MIFVTVGTTPFPFNRMSHFISNYLSKKFINELIVYQHGTSEIKDVPTWVKSVRYLSFFATMQYLRRAKIVVSHGGPATIMQAVAFGKTTLVLPRRREHGEHVNNHQVDFTDFMVKKSKIILVEKINEYSNISVVKLGLPQRSKPDTPELTRFFIKHYGVNK